MRILSLSLTLLSGILLGMNLQSCAQGSKPITRKFQKKLYRFCQDFEAKENGLSSPVGMLCNRVKIKKKYISTPYNICEPETFKKFRDANIVCQLESTPI